MTFNREAQYMANKIEIEKADASKIEEYKELFKNCSLYDHCFKKTDLLDQKLNEDISKGHGFVAVDRDGVTVGYATIVPSDPLADGLPLIKLLAVKPDKRGRGIGQMLLKFYEGVMAGIGYTECGLVVCDWNPRARKLFDSLGYKLRKSFDDKVVGGYVDHLLVKKIG